MSTCPAYDHAALRRSFKSIRDPSPLLEAMLEWYAGLDEVDQYEVEQDVQNIIFRFKWLSDQAFGPAQALELLGALIAIECGWKNGCQPPPHLSQRSHIGKNQANQDGKSRMQ